MNAAGQQSFQAVRSPSGYMGGLRTGSPQTITLRQGDEATAVLEGTDISSTGAACPRSTALLVTLPNTVEAARFSDPISTCVAPAIHPLLTGTTGTTG